MPEILEMSQKELDRLKILYQVQNGRISQIIAAKLLKISDRQVRNLLNQLNLKGDKGIISKKRGKIGNHRLSTDLKLQILKVVRECYPDFGPTLAAEYLENKHNLKVSVETLRQWMIEVHLWVPKTKKRRSHQPRSRRALFGELVQIDGSPHPWFEERGDPCTLMVCIDDATSTVTALCFVKVEDLEAYYKVIEKHLKGYGIPLSWYGDRCSVLISRQPSLNEGGTQCALALKELGCELLLANSPQAKGRVERVNRTLQDRLVKFLRIKGVRTIEEGNAVLEEYRKQHNELFSKKPDEQMDAHRPLDGICLEHVLCIRESRTLTKDFIIQFQNKLYSISSQDGKIKLFPKIKIEVRSFFDGPTKAFFKGKELMMTPLSLTVAPMLSEKEIKAFTPKKIYHPPSTHPYKRFFQRKDKNLNMLKRII